MALRRMIVVNLEFGLLSASCAPSFLLLVQTLKLGNRKPVKLGEHLLSVFTVIITTVMRIRPSPIAQIQFSISMHMFNKYLPLSFMIPWGFVLQIFGHPGIYAGLLFQWAGFATYLLQGALATV